MLDGDRADLAILVQIKDDILVEVPRLKERRCLLFMRNHSRRGFVGSLPRTPTPGLRPDTLEQVTRNPAAQITNRVAALRGLGRIATPEVQELLLGYAHDVDPRLQQAAFAALGLFADR